MMEFSVVITTKDRLMKVECSQETNQPSELADYLLTGGDAGEYYTIDCVLPYDVDLSAILPHSVFLDHSVM